VYSRTTGHRCLRAADAFEEIPGLEGSFDFVFIDAWKPDYLAFFELIRDRVVPGGTIAAHNVTSHADDMRDYLRAVQADPDFVTTVHEISSQGMTVSVRRTADEGQ